MVMGADGSSRIPLPILLDSQLRFPDPAKADSEGMIAVGGDLSVRRLLLAYRSGIFPWTVHPITWWSPDPRGVIEIDEFQAPRSLARLIRKQPFTVTMDQAFRHVMEGCAAPAAGRDTTWITAEFIDAYTRLHREGHAHSVECWKQKELVGGVYGVAIGGLFAAESMFHRVSNASKVALCALIDRLRERNFKLLDVQMVTPATQLLGAISVPREEYLRRLKKAVEHECVFK
jgi:leucyl/phenylalanyl-tRNA--protein transferase